MNEESLLRRIKEDCDKALSDWAKGDEWLEGIRDGLVIALKDEKDKEEYDSIIATLEIQNDKEACLSLREAMEDARAGRFLTHKEVFGKENH